MAAEEIKLNDYTGGDPGSVGYRGPPEEKLNDYGTGGGRAPEYSVETGALVVPQHAPLPERKPQEDIPPVPEEKPIPPEHAPPERKPENDEQDYTGETDTADVRSFLWADMARTAARLSGYTWGQINSHEDDATRDAYLAGYTKPEIDTHLGYKDSAPLANRISDALQEGTHEPLASPLEGQEIPEAGKAAGPVQPDLAQAYADALRNGEVRDPDEFARLYAKQLGLDPAHAEAVARDLAAQLPHPELLTDAAIAANHANGNEPALGVIGTVRQNLADLWAKTGMPPAEAAQSKDPVLLDALATPPVPPQPIYTANSLVQQEGGERSDEIVGAERQAIQQLGKSVYDFFKFSDEGQARDDEFKKIRDEKIAENRAEGKPLLQGVKLINPEAVEYGLGLGFGLPEAAAAKAAAKLAAHEGLQALGDALVKLDASAQKGAASFFELTGKVVADESGALKPAVPVGSGKPPEKGLVVAGIDDAGKIHYGKPGDTHGDLLNLGEDFVKGGPPSGEARNIVSSGFAGPDGKFLTRKEALEATAPTDAVRGKPFAKESGELDAHDYNETKRPIEPPAVESLGKARAEKPIETPVPESVKAPPEGFQGPLTRGQAPEKGFVVAYRDGSRVYAGEPGQWHAMLAEEMADEGHSWERLGAMEDGFVGPDGKFYNRKEALAAIPNHPVNLTNEPGKLHGDLDAAEYNEAGGANASGNLTAPQPTEIAKAAHAAVEEHYFGNHPIEDALFRLSSNAGADRDVMYQMLGKLPKELRTDSNQARIYADIERRLVDPNRKFSPETEAYLAHPEIKALTDRQFSNAARLAELTKGTTVEESFRGLKNVEEGHVHRVAVGEEMRGSALDPHTSRDAITGANIGGRTLSGKTPSLEHRSFYIEEKDGVRQFGTTSLDNLKHAPGTGENAGRSFRYGEVTPDGWTIKQPTSAEIEQHTAGTPHEVKFNQNHLAATIEDVLAQERTIRNLEFIGKQKPELTAKKLFQAVTDKNRFNGPDGWVRTEVPQLDGWMHPSVGHTINDFFAGGKGDLENILAKVSRGILSSLFITPTAHWFNVGAHWMPARGWDWINPVGYGRLLSTGSEAIRQVWQRGDLYQQLRREGNSLLYGDAALGNYWNTMQGKFIHDITADQGGAFSSLARMVLHPVATALDLAKAVYAFSRRGLWLGGDIMMMQRVLELQRPRFNMASFKFDKPGLPAREAIYQAERDIPNYRVPSQVGKFMGDQISHGLGQAIQSPLAMNFGRYHYGLVRALGLMVRDMVSPYATMKERVEGVGKALALAGMGMYMLPKINSGLQDLTGNPNLELRPPGPLSPIMAAKGFVGGEKDWLSSVSSIYGLSPVVALAGALTTGRDVYGRPIENAATPLGKITKGLEFAADQIYPLKILHDMWKHGTGEALKLLSLNPNSAKPDEATQAKYDKQALAQAAGAERKDPVASWVRDTIGPYLPDAVTGALPSGGGGRPRGAGGRTGGGNYNSTGDFTGGGSAAASSSYDTGATTLRGGQSTNGYPGGSNRPARASRATARPARGARYTRVSRRGAR